MPTKHLATHHHHYHGDAIGVTGYRRSDRRTTWIGKGILLCAMWYVYCLFFLLLINNTFVYFNLPLITVKYGAAMMTYVVRGGVHCQEGE
jgi:hypothetical protein